MNHLLLNRKITLPIHGLGSSGEGVGNFEGFTVFVEGALPGETVEVLLFECHKRYGRGQLLSIVKSSPDRVKPTCQYFGTCGGCQLMHLSYSKQLEEKNKRVVDAIRRIGRIEDCLIEPCIPSPTSLSYRNKIQLPVRNGPKGIEIGLYSRGSHDLVEIDRCDIHSPLGEKVFKVVKEIVRESSIEAYDPSTMKGELRHLLIKTAVNNNQVLVILVTNRKPTEELLKIAQKIIDACPEVRGVVHNLQEKHDNVILGNQYTTLVGMGFIHEILSGLTFKVSPASFFQVNPDQAERLYAKALEFAELKPSDKVLDAYCGVGTLALIFAKHVKHVLGVECVQEAIQDAKENANLNHIENVDFICATSEAFLKSVKKSEFDHIILNPPRKGCDPLFLKGIQRLSPKKLVYISCDPATLARDLAILKGYGYHVDVIQPFDMFPQTSHVECVAKLTKTD